MNEGSEAARAAARHGPSTGDYALLALLGLIFGATYMFIGVGLKTIPPFTLAAARVLIGLAALST
ncbi:MAG: hypothetical protein ACREIP_11110, partial [Alphaproteobacteria bacterium]